MENSCFEKLYKFLKTTPVAGFKLATVQVLSLNKTVAGFKRPICPGYSAGRFENAFLNELIFIAITESANKSSFCKILTHQRQKQKKKRRSLGCKK